MRHHIYDTVVNGAGPGIEFFHGYTYSGHPLAAAAALATLDVYDEEGLYTRGKELGPYWENALHHLKGLPHVIDLRNLGLVAAVELEPRPDAPGARAYEIMVDCFERGVLVRITGDTIALSPPLIVEPKHIDRLFDTVADSVRRVK